jgi:hypothetical protein
MDLSFVLGLGFVVALGIAVERSLVAYRLSRRRRELEEEVRALSEMNELLSENLSRKVGKTEGVLAEFVRDLERLRTAIAGSGTCERILKRKYRVEVGVGMLRRIFDAYPSIGMLTKQQLADEILVGELGRQIMRELESGTNVEEVSGAVEAPLAVVKGQIRRLQLLGYLDGTLKPTPAGKRVLSQPAQ